MTCDIMTIIDLLDELDLDIVGFGDAPSEPSLFFPMGLYHPEASTSALDEASTDDDDLPTFELLEEIELGPRTWVAAAPPIWDDFPEPKAARPTEDQPLRRVFQTLTIDVPPRSPTRSSSRLLPKENLASPTSPTERAFARLRDRGSSLALRAMNSALDSHRVLI
ncbi:hypothetical protein B0H19DRAFT_1251395 [Mycena capillaripes]|nr:hypothetical protein B0H19DRAFT_1251395 [Mycena capillaripes]